MQIRKSVVMRESQAAMHEGVLLPDEDSRSLNAPRSILQSTLAALSKGRISEVVSRFDDRFKFNDSALTLEFADKTRLNRLCFEKARDLLPDTALEVVSLMESGDHAVAGWMLTGTQTPPYFFVL
jgi:hypothetical protein